jgi:hypothetical protein
MTKKLCDACGAEIRYGSLYDLLLLGHSYDLCPKCGDRLNKTLKTAEWAASDDKTIKQFRCTFKGDSLGSQCNLPPGHNGPHRVVHVEEATVAPGGCKSMYSEARCSKDLGHTGPHQAWWY